MRHESKPDPIGARPGECSWLTCSFSTSRPPSLTTGQRAQRGMGPPLSPRPDRREQELRSVRNAGEVPTTRRSRLPPSVPVFQDRVPVTCTPRRKPVLNVASALSQQRRTRCSSRVAGRAGDLDADAATRPAVEIAADRIRADNFLLLQEMNNTVPWLRSPDVIATTRLRRAPSAACDPPAVGRGSNECGPHADSSAEDRQSLGGRNSP